MAKWQTFDLEKYFWFILITIESVGSWGEDGTKLFCNIGQILKEVTGEKGLQG